MNESICEICGHRDHRVLRACRDQREGTGYSGWLLRCKSCGIVSTYPVPEPDALLAYYPESYTPHARRTRSGPNLAPLRGWMAGPAHGAGALARRALGAVYNTFSYRSIPIARRPGRLLDVGCGTGDFLADMADLGWEGLGVELSPAAVARARERGLEVVEGTLDDDTLSGRRFDLVTLWHVLEHLPRPVAALRRARHLLSRGGTLALAVPNWDSWARRTAGDAWWCLEVPRHLFHYTAETLDRVLRRAGFQDIRVHSKSRSKFLTGTVELLLSTQLGAARPLVSLALLPLDLAATALGHSDTLWATAAP